ncbi:MFS transporter [Streptomyces spiramenti]|uniref:MFS transporter n=1 Tax=Streptomyces spiramenti TaxID=2720606 RepID=A0ABX1AP49_9ACTN|nr:MFS transporter [Streptomyces spiramenti]NJP66438.1 MFS transporter [Streptomyces spiramenti]
MKHFRLLVFGNAISGYGSYLNMVALNVFVYQVTGSAFAAGLFMAVRLLTSVAAGFVSGRLVSRFDRKALMIGSDLVRSVMLLVLIPLPDTARLPVLFALAVAMGACTTLHQVALRSSVPEIVGPEKRLKANGLLVTGRSLAMIAGFASSGLVIAQFGYTAAFALNGVTFLVSAVILALLPIRTRSAVAPGASGDTGDTGAAESGDGAVARKEDDAGRAAGRWVSWALLRSLPVMAAMMAVRGADGLGSSSHNVALPVFSDALDPANPATFMSQFLATWAIGHIVAQQATSRYADRTGHSFGEKAFAVGAVVMSVAFILAFAGLPTVPAVAVALIAGMADGFTEIVYVTKLQETPDAQRGQMFGISAAVENGGFGLGMILCSLTLEFYSPIAVVGLFHGVAIAFCLGFLAFLARRGRRGTPAAEPPGSEPSAPGEAVSEPAPVAAAPGAAGVEAAAAERAATGPGDAATESGAARAAKGDEA